jgi:hypothetical protein
MIIDAHLHLPVRDNLSTLAEKPQQLLKDLKSNNIDAAILIPDNVKNSPIGDLDECLDLFHEDNNIFIMGTLDILTDEADVLQKLSSLFNEKKIVAIKIFPGHDKHLPNDKRLHDVFELCIKYNAPLVIHTGWNSGDPSAADYNDPKYIVEVAKVFNKLKIVISHFFWLKIEYCLELTKSFENIYFDTSGLADEEVIEHTGKEQILCTLNKAITKYSKKVLFGTDYGMCSLADHKYLIDSLNISDEAKKEIFWDNTIEVFNLKKRF